MIKNKLAIDVNGAVALINDNEVIKSAWYIWVDILQSINDNNMNLGVFVLFIIVLFFIKQ